MAGVISNERPANVGILAMEVYFPKTFVAQSDLEAFDGVSSGKYTLGLGQNGMSFTGDREDVNSIALTVVTQLLEKYNIVPTEIGRLEVGTETLVDKSKSTKTVLMQLFEASGNTSVEGVSTVNACFGATAALFNALAWVESSAWDGRYAIVVGTDIAVYAKGAARPTGGCGGVAMLIGPDAPLVVDSRTRATFSSNIWDFYKPDPSVEYPTVDGRLSQSCYLRALDTCYATFCEKNERFRTAGRHVGVKDVDYAVFHSPYNKLVQKSFSRLFFLDYVRQGPDAGTESKLSKWRGVPLDQTYGDRELDLASREACGALFVSMAQPCHVASKDVGNCYTASVYFNLATLVHTQAAALAGKRVMVFSYGSGCMASMFAVDVREATDSRFSLDAIASSLNIFKRLGERTQVSAHEYDKYMEIRHQFHGKHSVKPEQPLSTLFDGAYYLEAISANFQRTYARKGYEQNVGKVSR